MLACLNLQAHYYEKMQLFFVLILFSATVPAQWVCIDEKGESYTTVHRIWAHACSNSETGVTRKPGEMPPTTPAPFKANKKQTEKVIAQGKIAVLDLLKDPISAQFRNLLTYRDKYFCGEVNAKNSMGGYSGFTRFMYLADTGEAVLDNQGRTFDYQWFGFCRGFSKELVDELKYGR